MMRIVKEDVPVESMPLGYVFEGAATTTNASGEQETATKGDLFYWPPGHTVKSYEQTELILFSPQEEHSQVIEHLRGDQSWYR